MEHLKAAAPSLVGLVLASLGPLLANLRLVAPIHGFGLMALGLLALLLASLVLLVRGFAGKAARVPALLIGGLPLAAVGVFLVGRVAEDVPPINDISTDLSDPPAITVQGRTILSKHDLNYPPEFVAQVEAGYPDLASKTLAMSRDEAFARVQSTVDSTAAWTVHRSDPASGILEASEETGTFRFVDDFVIRVVTEGEGAKVDMRSRSRDGRSDLGVNAARIRGLFARL